ncbi:MAG: nitrous oxide reductase family maturation protein NosD [Gemmatimonadaceae bacterium]
MIPRRSRTALAIAATVLLAAVVLAPVSGSVSAQGNGASSRTAPSVVNVSTDGPVRSVRSALKIVARGGTIVVHPGTYRDTTITVTIPVTILGEGFPVLDGESMRQIMTVSADSVTVRGLNFRNVGVAYTEDLAAIKVIRGRDCVIADNRIDNAFFGIYLQEASNCRVERNVIIAAHLSDATSGNGIHLWHSRDITIVGNKISGQRDGIYFEFVRQAHVRDNLSENNIRYGLHFMFSDSCDYENNTFRHNGAGVAVMYTHNVRMVGNRFVDNVGAAAYGLLLKEISDSQLLNNLFARNTSGLYADGATRLNARHNTFLDNGWALKLQSSTEDAVFIGNNFSGNTFDVSTNSRSTSSTFSGNYWSAYRGYDLNRDGKGDVPYHPVRLASVIVAQIEPALILLRSNFLELLDAAERVIPALTPATLADNAPSMRWVQ